MELMQMNELQQVLQEYAGVIRDKYKDNLQESMRRASGGLIDSIKTQVKTTEGGFEVTMTLADYWKYVEEDTKPHFPPLDKILSWIQIKPIIPRPFDNGKIPTPKQLAYLIGRAMAGLSPNQQNCKNPNGGTTGTHDLAKSKDEVMEMFRSRISEALGHDMQDYIRKVIINK